MYAIAYGSPSDVSGEYGGVILMWIDDWGNIPMVEPLASIEFNTFYGREPSFIHLTDDYYAISYGGTTNGLIPSGYLVTLSIDPPFMEFIEDLNDLWLGRNIVQETDIILIDESNMIVAIVLGTGLSYTDLSGYILTIDIPDNGEFVGGIEDYLIDDYYYNPRQGLEPTIIHVQGDIYAISYGTANSQSPGQGCLKTIKINQNGGIGSSEGWETSQFLSSFTYEESFISETDIIKVSNSMYLVAYSSSIEGDNVLKTGFVHSISINSNNGIIEGVLDSYTFTDDLGFIPSIVEVPDPAGPMGDEVKTYAIAFGQSEKANGFLGSVEIDLLGITHDLFIKDGQYALTSSLNTVSMSINDAVTISNYIIPGEWNLIVATYDMQHLRLYVRNIDGLKETDMVFNVIINSGDSDLIIGKFNGTVDHTAIYSIILDVTDIEKEWEDNMFAHMAGGDDDEGSGGSIEDLKGSGGSDSGGSMIN